ncbi:MAG: hypothetical protein ABI594_06180 [Ginsengibacter sp.]
MEDNFYLDDFELSLKEQANQFKMTPSKKVWHGIYNDMHPGRRWPSITISLLLVISIVFVGYINTHNDKALTESKVQAPVKNETVDKEQTGTTNEKAITSAQQPGAKNNGGISSAPQVKDLASVSPGISQNQNNSLQGALNIVDNKGNTNINNTSAVISGNAHDNSSPRELKSANSYLKKQILNFSPADNSIAINEAENGRQIKNNNIVEKDLYGGNLFEIPGRANGTELLTKSMAIFPTASIINNSSLISSISANEIYADKNSSVANTLLSSDKKISSAALKQRSKTTWLFYVAPFVSSASFNGDHLTENPNQNSLSLPQVTQKDMRIIHHPALGYEAGIQMNYLFAKKLQFTAGVQFTRSGYNITSSEVHPTLTSLLLKDKATGDQYSRNFVTHYGDGNGQSTTTLHNYSYQASIPVGVQYQLLGNDKVQFDLGINVEPSLTLKSNAYLLSSDGRNYVNVPDLYRKWNLNSSFTPFITFKSNKFKWNLGPVLRYQWLSSYLDDYTRKEHLFDYGLRLGISK